jgi:hypothetical protein
MPLQQSAADLKRLFIDVIICIVNHDLWLVIRECIFKMRHVE